MGRPPPRPATIVEGQLPAVGGGVVAHDIKAAIVAAELHIAVVGSKPAVEDLLDLDYPLAKVKPLRRGPAFVTGIAFHMNGDRVQGGPLMAATAPGKRLRYGCLVTMLVALCLPSKAWFLQRSRPCVRVLTAPAALSMYGGETGCGNQAAET